MGGDMNKRPSDHSLARITNFGAKYCEKSGTTTHPDAATTDVVVLGLAANLDTLGKPLCPCRFYPDKQEEVTHRTWICACDDMQVYKYCHCLLFVNADGLPITEYLPEGHDGRLSYGIVRDPTPEKGRPLRHKCEERERERRERRS
jgi:ferredoxin-thioredoxin reductase catalytic chain